MAAWLDRISASGRGLWPVFGFALHARIREPQHRDLEIRPLIQHDTAVISFAQSMGSLLQPSVCSDMAARAASTQRYALSAYCRYPIHDKS